METNRGVSSKWKNQERAANGKIEERQAANGETEEWWWQPRSRGSHPVTMGAGCASYHESYVRRIARSDVGRSVRAPAADSSSGWAELRVVRTRDAGGRGRSRQKGSSFSGWPRLRISGTGEGGMGNRSAILVEGPASLFFAPACHSRVVAYFCSL